MASLKRTDKGIQVSGVEGFPDGTVIPYDYDPNYDKTTPDALKQMAVQILQYAAQQDAQGGVDSSPQPGDPLGGYADNMEPTERMGSSGNDYLDRSWSWFNKPEPAGMYRKQPQYRQAPYHTVKKKATTKKTTTKPRATAKPRKKTTKKTAKK
jgi:hypothetical protein